MSDEANDRGAAGVDRVAQVAGRVAEQVADRLAPLRAAGWRALGQREGAVVRAIRKVNDALGRPLAPADELEDRRAFARGYRDAGAAAGSAAGSGSASGSGSATGSASATGSTTASAPAKRGEPAPVLVYYMDKQKRDLAKITDILDSHGIPYKLASLEEDPAAQAAVRRDSKGLRLPLVFIAGDCIGGREQLVNLGKSGLDHLVFGA